MDSIFSPVRRVAYQVEAARVGQRTDYDKLTLDITTDGSVDPKDALGEAAEILIRQLAIFTDLDRIEGFGEAAAVDGGATPETALAHGMENFPIEELELGVRSYNCLKRVGIETIGDLVMKTRAGARRDPELRQEVDRGSPGDAAAARSQPPRRERLRRVRRRSKAMRHARTGKKLGRDSSHRKALYSNLACSLIEHGRIRTTEAKAKAVKPFAEQMITLGRRGDLHARRQALAELRSQEIVHKLFSDVGPRFAERRAATRGSSSSVRARVTRPTWSTWNWSTTSPSPV